MRILVTGSRQWKYRLVLSAALIYGHRNVKNGRDYCTAAGNYRNQEMVDAGADICLAFYQPGAACIGTSDCVRRCTRAGITVRPYGRDLAMGFILTSGIQAARRFRSVVL
jgi:coenzyme F420-reducing hydrogenase gamma subunit